MDKLYIHRILVLNMKRNSSDIILSCPQIYMLDDPIYIKFEDSLNYLQRKTITMLAIWQKNWGKKFYDNEIYVFIGMSI